MTDTEIVERAADRAHDRTGHRLVWLFVGLALVGVAALTVVVVQLAVRAEDNAVAARALADQVEQLGAVPVVDPPAADDPDPNDPDPDDPERQDAEVQDPEIQDPEQQDLEVQESEAPDVERDDPDPDDPEIQDEEIQDPEVDDPPVPGPAGPPGPTCPPGYTAQARAWEGAPLDPSDDETWWVCVQDPPNDGS